MSEPRLVELFDQGRRAWPHLRVDFEAFLAQLGPPPEELARVDAAGLYLACACAAGDDRAMAALEERYFGGVAAALARLDTTGALTDEVLQVLRLRLFTTGAVSGPKIGAYSGAGHLGGWLRVTAVRLALRVIRRDRRGVPGGDDPLLDEPTGQPDPELALLKARYGSELRAAFTAAMRSLSSRERTLLRQHVLDGLTIDQLARLYDVHRATAARWLVRARGRLVAATKRELLRRLGIERRELSTIMRLVRTQLDLSIRMLATPTP